MRKRKYVMIVLTGGPHGGKSSVLNILRQTLEDLGYAVILLPEAATEFINSGIKKLVVDEMFQKLLLQYILTKQALAVEAAKAVKSQKPVVILCDRGAMDNAAYVTPEQFASILKKLKTTVVKLRDHYDAVIHLRTTAIGTDLYSCKNNAARTETREQAAKMDERTLTAWHDHPHVRVAENGPGGFEAKTKKVLGYICQVLGIPHPVEVEKKFVLRKKDLRKIKHLSTGVEIIQTYLRSRKGTTERVRARGQNNSWVYFHTIKQPTGRPGENQELEVQISGRHYRRLLKRANSSLGIVRKRRRYFVYKGQYFEVDVFENPKSLVVMELELSEHGDKVHLPPYLKRAKDVTGNPRYTNRSIAKRLAPKRKKKVKKMK